MKLSLSPFLIGITAVNLAATLFTMLHLRSAVSEDLAPVLRGRGLQIVDERGQVRASISVLPAQAQANGETSPEMVLLRLITEQGRPSVKISAAEEAAGVMVAGPSNTRNTYAVLQAKRTASSLTLKDEDGGQRLIEPAR
jgi:hypothetical protein